MYLVDTNILLRFLPPKAAQKVLAQLAPYRCLVYEASPEGY